MELNFVFEDINNKGFDGLFCVENYDPSLVGNLLSKNTAVPGGNRFHFPPSIRRLFLFPENFNIKVYPTNNRPDSYIFAVGVGHEPDEWTGGGYGNNKDLPSPFDLLDNQTVFDLQHRRAILLIDQSFEGYQTDWLWEYFYTSCKKINIPPNNVVYVTGNQVAADQHNVYAQKNNIESFINVVPIDNLDVLIYDTFKKLQVDFEKIIEFKSKNDIKLYDCINHRPRIHRKINFWNLFKEGLIDDGYITMSHSQVNTHIPTNLSKYGLNHKTAKLANELLPLQIENVSCESITYPELSGRILQDLYLKTWVSVVTEASFMEEENTVFISEKTFKPITCMQPFIIVGSKFSLHCLRKLGYRTFHPYIDESYDTADDADRFVLIINSLKKIKGIQDKLSWLQSIREVVEHNHTHFRNSVSISKLTPVVNYYVKYFKEMGKND
jgi:hypothetical protein